MSSSRFSSVDDFDEWDRVLYLGVQHECFKGVIDALKNGANVEIQLFDQMTPLHIAVEKGSIQIIEILLKHGANVNSLSHFGESILMTATKRGHKEIISILIKYGVNINAKNKMKKTALNIAVNKNDKEICEMLIKHGAVVNSVNVFGESIIHSAVVRQCDPTLVTMLLNTGGSLTDTDSCGHTAVHRLVLASGGTENKTTGYMSDLLDDHPAMADFPCANTGRRKPIHAAAVAGHPETVAAVLARTRDATAATTFGVTPRELAAALGNREAADAIDRHVAAATERLDATLYGQKATLDSL